MHLVASWGRGVLALSILADTAGFAATDFPPQKSEVALGESAQPKPEHRVDADALNFGAALEGQASPELKNWIQSYTRNEMRKRLVDPTVAIAAVDQRFPDGSGEARGAATYLLFYTAYRDERENQRKLEAYISSLDRKSKRDQDEKKRDMPTGQPVPPWAPGDPVPPGAAAAVQRQEETLRSLSGSSSPSVRQVQDERRKPTLQLEISLKKATFYGDLLSISYKHMKSTDPAILHTLR